jgi:hypothetical protein
MTIIRGRRDPPHTHSPPLSDSVARLLLLPPIPQDQSYHEFADRRTLFGTPNFWNVVSNFPLIVIGLAGLRQFQRNPGTLFLGIMSTGFGSSYYHLDPNDRTLFLDRLPMSVTNTAARITGFSPWRFTHWPNSLSSTTTCLFGWILAERTYS